MARKLDGSYITANTITTTQLSTVVVTQIQAGGGGGPKVKNVIYPGNDTAANTAGGQTVYLTGSGFVTNTTIMINGNTVPSVTYISPSNIQFTTPALSASTYPVYVINPEDGAMAILYPGIIISGEPSWVTASSITAAVNNSPFSIQLQATGDAPITYTLANGSTLPSNTTLTSGGLLSGNVVVENSTNYSFTIIATDAQSQDTPRTFTLPVSTSAGAFTISPSVSGKSTWDLTADGPLNIGSNATYTIVPTKTFTGNLVMWGAGGGAGNQGGTGGAGGFSTGLYQFTANQSYYILIGQGGRAGGGAAALGGGGIGDVYRGNGGGYTGIFVGPSAVHANSIMIAGGGGGAGGGSGSGIAGAGGGTNGQNGNEGQGAFTTGGTQSAGGTGSGGGQNGSALQGGGGLSGGGGGYYGGGAGGDSGSYAASGGGGSGYISPNVTSGNTTAGNLNTAAQSANPLRNNAGNSRSGSAGAGTDGRFYLAGL